MAKNSPQKTEKNSPPKTTKNSSKLKLLYLMKIFQEETDPDHGLTMPDIISKLQEDHGIEAQRKSIYADIHILRKFEIDIRKLPHTQPIRYALAERDFETSHLSLLIDAVQSSRFLTEGSSNALIKSIKRLASKPERAQLDKEVHVFGRPRFQSQSDFCIVDTLQEAISKHCKISFLYFRYNAYKKKVARKGGAVHIATPVTLLYTDDNYYLVAYSDADEEMRNYRVCRMEEIRLLDEPAVVNETISSYDPDATSKHIFGMYEGTQVDITLVVKDSAMNVVIDRFGPDVASEPIDNGAAARIHVTVKQSPVFFGWLAMLGTAITIEKPHELREAYLAYLQDIQSAYETDAKE